MQHTPETLIEYSRDSPSYTDANAAVLYADGTSPPFLLATTTNEINASSAWTDVKSLRLRHVSRISVDDPVTGPVYVMPELVGSHRPSSARMIVGSRNPVYMEATAARKIA